MKCRKEITVETVHDNALYENQREVRSWRRRFIFLPSRKMDSPLSVLLVVTKKHRSQHRFEEFLWRGSLGAGQRISEEVRSFSKASVGINSTLAIENPDFSGGGANAWWYLIMCQIVMVTSHRPWQASVELRSSHE